ncbi:hypothetical protein OAM07_05075 [Crocinitomicaceae bacterium]|nr:hypothetical protein [Crocinitomicaceae bacterium]MDC0460109.1 hypothetical protein [Crocinitomicaceae bacterium]
MKNLMFFLLAIPLFFSCGDASSDASDDIKKESSACEFVQIQKDMFNDILNGMPIEEANKKYAKSKDQFEKMTKENKEDFEEFKQCTKGDNELNNIITNITDFAKKNRIQEIEGIFSVITIDDSVYE